MDAHRSRLLGGGSFGHPGQVLLEQMDLRVSPILRMPICVIFKPKCINTFFTCHFDVCKYVVSYSILALMPAMGVE